MRSLNYKISAFWLCLWGLVAIGLSEQYVLNRAQGRGVFEDQSYNDPIGEFTDHERRTFAYGASRSQPDNDMDGVSEDESEDDEKEREMKEWFLGKIDEHRKELASIRKEVKKEAKNQGETEEDREALRREEEKNERQQEKKKKKSSIPIPGQLFEGDIVMTKHFRDHITRRDEVKRDALKYKQYQWPKSEDGFVYVPYDVDENFNSLKQERLRQAVEDYNKYTCIRFVPKKEGDKDFLHFFSNKSMCYSSVGKQGGKQMVSIGDGCERKGTLIHEMLHSIGFIHEHSRPDRDKYVKIIQENIKPKLKHNFEKYPGYLVENEDVKYDIDSVLQYHNSAFSKNGEDTIVYRDDPDRKFGQRIGFSMRNVEQVNKYYKCVVDSSKMDDIQFE